MGTEEVAAIPRKELKLNTKRSNSFEVYEIGGNSHNLECLIYHPNRKKKKIYIYIYICIYVDYLRID